MEGVLWKHAPRFVNFFGWIALTLHAEFALAQVVPVEVIVRDTVIATVGPEFMGLQYNGPIHQAIDPETGQLADFPSAYATPSTQSALNAAGIGVVRVFVDVPQVHPSPGVFDWTDTDTAVAEIEASGMVPMLSLNQRDGTWFVGDSQQPWWTDAAGRQEWTVLAGEIANRYGNSVPNFELLNEPNLIHTTNSSYMGWQTSVDLFLDAADAIHQIAPGASVGGPASYGSWEPATWANKVLAEPNGEQQLDFVSYHIYASGNPNDTDDEIFATAELYETAPAAIRASLAQATNKPIEIALTEFNTSSVWTWNGSLYTDPRNVDAIGGLVASLGWLYSVRGGSDMALRFGTMGGFGLIRWPPDYELQPAYHAVHLLHEIGGLTPNAELLTTDVTSGQNDAVELFTIKNGDEKAVIVVNTDATETASVEVQFESGPTAGTWDVFQYNAGRLSTARDPLTQVAMVGGIAQIQVPPHTLAILRESQALPHADFDGDLDIDGADFLIWQRGFGLSGQTDNANGDADGNGVVDGGDLIAWEGQFGSGTGYASSLDAVPEPSTASLVVVAMATLLILALRSANSTAPT